MKNNTVIIGFLFFVLFLTFHVTHLSAAEQPPSQSSKQLKSKIKTISKSIQLKESKMSRLQKKMYSTDRQIAALSKSLTKLKEEIESSQSRLVGLEQEKSQLEEKISKTGDSLADMSRIFYMLQMENPFKAMINRENISKSNRLKTYHDYLIKEFEYQSKQLNQQLSSLSVLDKSLIKRISKLEKLAEKNRVKSDKLKASYKQRSKDVARLSNEIKSGAKKVKRLKTDQKRLEKLAKEIEKLKIAKKSSGMSFAKQKGGLSWPVNGRVIQKFGRSRAGTKLKWRGVLIETQAGAGVNAVAGGQVVFADWLTGYGHVLIVEHGRGYMSLYAHNQQLLKSVGDKVHENQQIALAGNSGRSGKPALYFEIRHRGKPVNPAKWIVARKSRQ